MPSLILPRSMRLTHWFWRDRATSNFAPEASPFLMACSSAASALAWSDSVRTDATRKSIPGSAPTGAGSFCKVSSVAIESAGLPACSCASARFKP